MIDVLVIKLFLPCNDMFKFLSFSTISTKKYKFNKHLSLLNSGIDLCLSEVTFLIQLMKLL